MAAVRHRAGHAPQPLRDPSRRDARDAPLPAGGAGHRAHARHPGPARSAPYAGIVSLRPLDVFRSALPSKMFESMAVGQPLVAALWGEGADVVRDARCGVVTEPGNARELRDAVESLARDPEGAKQMGRNGRAYVDEHFNRDKLAVQLARILREVARPR